MSLPSTQKPAWYEHNLHNDFGQVVNTIIADHDGPVFGKPGVDHSEDFKVVTLPLYGAAVVEQLVAANTEYARRHLEQLGEVERLRTELGEAKGEYDRSANKVAALTDQLAAFEALHGGELGLPKEGWPEYHKRKMESLRDLTAGLFQRKLAKQDALLAEIAKRHWSGVDFDLPADLVARIQALSAMAETGGDLCAEGAHEFVPFQDKCVKCSEPYRAAPVPKISPEALRVAMENLAVRASVDRPVPVYMSAPAQIGPLVILGKVCLRVHYKGLKWYHEQLLDDCWEPLAVEEFDALLAEALSKA